MKRIEITNQLVRFGAKRLLGSSIKAGELWQLANASRSDLLIYVGRNGSLRVSDYIGQTKSISLNADRFFGLLAERSKEIGGLVKSI